jgi:hypothetical protein
MVVINGFAVTATVIVACPAVPDDDELPQAATVIVTAAAAVMTLGHRRRRRRALVRVMCSSCYELSSDADVPLVRGDAWAQAFAERAPDGLGERLASGRPLSSCDLLSGPASPQWNARHREGLLGRIDV